MNLGRLVTYVLGGLLIFACLGWAWSSRQRGAAERDRTRAEVQRDSLAAEAFVARQVARGWVVEFGVEDPERLMERLAELDSAMVRDAQASRVRIESLTRLLAEARAHVEGSADTVFLPTTTPGRVSSETQMSPDSTRGRLDDGLLEATWTYRYGPRTLGLDYLVSSPIELFGSRAGDGRTIVGARSPDPRVRVSVEEYVVAAQEIQRIRSCTIGQRAIAFGIGLGLGAVGGRFIP